MAKHGRTRSFMVAAALGSAFLAACGVGSGKVNGSVVSGMALSDAPIGGGAVTLTDSSASVQERQVTTRADGSFTVDVSGLTAPYMLEVRWTGTSGTEALHAVSEGTETDVTPITDLAFDYAAGDTGDETLFETAGATRKRIAVNQATAVLTDVAAELAPLLNQYGIANLTTDTVAVRQLLQDVKVTQSSGMVTLSNRRTGGVIARGPRSNPTGGTFDPSQIPTGGSSGGQPSGSSSGATSSGGASSGGSSSTGASLYASRCAKCHGALAASGVKNATASAIVAKHANLVTSTEADLIAAALSGSSAGSSGGTSSGGTFDPCQMPTGAPPSSSGGTFDPGQMPTGAPPSSSGGTFDPGQMPTGAPPSSSGGTFNPGQMPPGAPPSSSGGTFDPSQMPTGAPGGGTGGCPIPGSSGGASSGGSSAGGTGGSTARLPPNHPTIASGATCTSCHSGGMAPGGNQPGGPSSGGPPGSSGGPPGSSGGPPGSSGGPPGSSGGSSSGTSSGGTSGSLPPNHPSVPAGSSCASCH